MKVLRLLLTVTFCANFVISLPPVDTAGDLSHVYAEVSTIKDSLRIFSEQWEKWNTHFITSLEPRLTTTVSTLASIDSNIHNLQERAHVWDTFQLHVSAWNEQLASLDRKIDIISKGQEKLQDVYESKIATLVSLENKVDNLFAKLSNIDDTLSLVEIVIKNKPLYSSRDSLFEEFAARGVLSSIKSVERKMDRVLLTTQNVIFKNKSNDENSRLTLKCKTPKIIEELVKDISSKVDVMFDVVTQKYAGADYGIEDYNENEGITDSTPLDLKLTPYNKAKRGLYLSSRGRLNYDDDTRRLEAERRNFEVSTESHQNCDTINFEPLYGRIKQYAEESTKNVSLIMESYFSEQRAHFESMIRKVDTMDCNSYPTTTKRSFISLFPTIVYDENEVTTNTAGYENQGEVTIAYSINTERKEDTTKAVTALNISSCADLDYTATSKVYAFKASTNQSNRYFGANRFCEIRDNGLWTLIQRRDNFTTQHNFNTSWSDYKLGFGDIENDFWLGNTILHEFTRLEPVILRVELEDFEGNSAWAEYQKFQVLSEDEKFQLIVSGYTGNASDSFSNHNGSYFSTHDRKNDVAPDCCPCAESYGGGWWFHSCFESNLNGVYYRNPHANDNFRGIIWEEWLGNYSLKKSVMMIKSRGIVYSSINKTKVIPDYEDP